MSGTHRGRGAERGRSRGADRHDPTGQHEEEPQRHQIPEVPHRIIPDPRTTPSMHFSQHMTPTIPQVHMSGSYMMMMVMVMMMMVIMMMMMMAATLGMMTALMTTGIISSSMSLDPPLPPRYLLSEQLHSLAFVALLWLLIIVLRIITMSI